MEDSVSSTTNNNDCACNYDLDKVKPEFAKPDGKYYKCDQCTKTFNIRKHMLAHVKSHANENGHKCGICSRSFKKRCNMLAHLNTHTEQFDHTCEVCSKSFRWRRDLVRHMKSHTDENRFKCTICPRSYTRRYNLSAHMKSHPEGRNRERDGPKTKHVGGYDCESCGKNFEWRCDMLRHTISHSKRKDHKCEICSESFTQKSSLTQHVSSHAKVYECEICAKGVQGKQNLLAHMEFHAEIRIYTCAICGKKFTRRESMVAHVETHASETEYKCKFCAKVFKRKHSLMIHLKAHTDENDYKCDVCYKSFKWRNNMLRHMKMHTHNGVEHICEICFRKFKRKQSASMEGNDHRCESCSKSFKCKDYLSHVKDKNHNCAICSKIVTWKRSAWKYKQSFTNKILKKCFMPESLGVRGGVKEIGFHGRSKKGDHFEFEMNDTNGSVPPIKENDVVSFLPEVKAEATEILNMSQIKAEVKNELGSFIVIKKEDDDVETKQEIVNANAGDINDPGVAYVKLEIGDCWKD